MLSRIIKPGDRIEISPVEKKGNHVEEENTISFIEWSENIENALPENTIYVELSVVSENEREIKIFKKGEDE